MNKEKELRVRLFVLLDKETRAKLLALRRELKQAAQAKKRRKPASKKNSPLYQN